MKNEIRNYSEQFHKIIGDTAYANGLKMPENTYFLEDGSILALPREVGDSRYPYGKNGFNFWTYASGYMHSNEGLFSPFLRASEGAEPKIAFFAGVENETGQTDVISLLAVPELLGSREDVVRYTVFTMAATYFITEVDNWLIAIRTMVDEKKHMYFSVEVIHKSSQTKNIWISTYFNPLIKNAMFENSTDRWFRKAEYIQQEPVGSFKFETYEERDRSSMSTNFGLLKKQVTLGQSQLMSYEITTSRSDFVGGSKSSLHTPKSLFTGSFGAEKSVCSFADTAIAGDILKLKITESARIDIRFSYCFTQEAKNHLIHEKITPKEIDGVLDKLKSIEIQNNKGLFMKCEGEALSLRAHVMNPFMEHLKKQVEFCSVIKGYVQLSSFSLIGIRDVFQALEGLIYWQSDVVKDKMLEALNFTSPDGRCPRQYALPTVEGHAPAMDLRPFIDQGVWVISTIVTYLRFTKDFDFLNQECGYYEFVDDKKHLAIKSDLRNSVLEHMLKIMDYLLENRDDQLTHCVCALYGDWNDALDGLGATKDPKKEYGTGVSVMATLQVYQNLTEMIELLTLLGKEQHSDLIAYYHKTQEEIAAGLNKYAVVSEGFEKRILHGWGDERSYLVGSYEDPDSRSRDGLTSNAFWVLSGLHEQDPSLKGAILGAYERLDSSYGFKTFEPHFEKNTYGVGRIPNLPAGTAENGAVYIHASLFAVMSLFKMGESKKAWEQLKKLLPFTHEKISLSPFVIPNSYGYNEVLSIDGESMGDWQTGSSNVLLKTFIRFVFGFEPHFKGIYIQPGNDQPFDHLEMRLIYQGKPLSIHYENAHREKRTFIVNGIEVEGQYDEMMQLNRLWLEDECLTEKSYEIKVLD